jgi:hypothetical protein
MGTSVIRSRQQLQVLRDLQFIDFLGAGHYQIRNVNQQWWFFLGLEDAYEPYSLADPKWILFEPWSKNIRESLMNFMKLLKDVVHVLI